MNKIPNDESEIGMRQTKQKFRSEMCKIFVLLFKGFVDLFCVYEERMR